VDNVVASLKPPTPAAEGIVIRSPSSGADLENVEIVGNLIHSFARAINGELKGRSLLIAHNQIENSDTGLTLRGQADGLVVEANQMRVEQSPLDVTVGRSRIAAIGNQFEMFGLPSPVTFTTDGDCTYSENHSLHLKPSGKEEVTLGGDVVVAASNRINGKVQMTIKAKQSRVTVLGNITGAQIIVNAAPLAAPWTPLNLQNT
jgi:hypothetical protein